jgi:anion-transporting  ArsA/GET3 family ATPase
MQAPPTISDLLSATGPKFIFVSGKGGVGKSTCAASIALQLARTSRTLLMSTDPAHNVADVLDIEIPKGGRELVVHEKLSVLEVDPVAAMREATGDNDGQPEEFSELKSVQTIGL